MATSDIGHGQHAAAMATLGEVRASYTRYLDVVEAQRVALQQDNMSLVARLSEHIDTIIAKIRDHSKTVASIYLTVRSPTTDGPRAQAVRDLMTAVVAEAALAQAAQRDLIGEMVDRRRQVARELDRLDSVGARKNSPYSRQPALVDASA